MINLITAKEIAERLDGIRYTELDKKINDELIKECEDNNLVIVNGCSDDLTEFAGVIVDEISSYNSCTVYIDPNNKKLMIYDYENRECRYCQFKNIISNYLEHSCVKINVDAKQNSECMFEYSASIPTARFTVIEDDLDQVYCYGIVISLDDKGDE